MRAPEFFYSGYHLSRAIGSYSVRTFANFYLQRTNRTEPSFAARVPVAALILVAGINTGCSGDSMGSEFVSNTLAQAYAATAEKVPPIPESKPRQINTIEVGGEVAREILWYLADKESFGRYGFCTRETHSTYGHQ